MATQNYYTKSEKYLFNFDYSKIRDFGFGGGNFPENKVKVLYEGFIWDCDKNKFVNPRDLGFKAEDRTTFPRTKIYECAWIELTIDMVRFMRQMNEDLNNLQRKLDKERGN